MKQNKRKYRNRCFCILDPDIIESRAFQDLSGKAALVCLIRFNQKAYKNWKKKNRWSSGQYEITNQGEITFTYAEAKELGIKSPDTFHRVLRELIEEKGFIDMADHKKRYYVPKGPSKFSISKRWKQYGTPNFEKVQIPRSLPKNAGFPKNKSRYDGSKRTATIDRSESGNSDHMRLRYVVPKILPFNWDNSTETKEIH